MPGIYGDLEIGFSGGSVTSEVPPIFLDKQILCYASGHTLQLMNVATRKNLDYVFTAKNLITSISFCAKENLLAISEKGYPDIQLLTTPHLKPYVMQRYLLGLTDDSTVSLCFSTDSSKLVSLGSAPNYTITLWDFRKGVILCQISNGGPASQVSVNPLNPHQICTSGSGAIRFWWLREGYKKFTIKSTSKDATFVRLEQQRIAARRYLKERDGSSTTIVSILDKIRDIRHEWNDKNQVMIVTLNYEVYAIDPITSECYKVISKGKIAAKIRSISFTKDQIIVARNDGIMEFVSNDGSGHILASLPLFPDSEVKSISLSSDHKLAIAASKVGDLALIDTPTRDFGTIRFNGLKWISAEYFFGKDLVTLTGSGSLTFWDDESHTEKYTVQLPSTKNCRLMAFHPFAPLVAIGTTQGYVQVFLLQVTGDVPNVYNEAKLVFQQKPLKASVNQLYFDNTGKYLAASSSEDVVLINSFDVLSIIGYFKVRGTVKQLQFFQLDEEKNSDICYLYVLTHENASNSLIYRFSLPIVEQLLFAPSFQRYNIGKDICPFVIYKLDDQVSNIYALSSNLTNGRDSFYAFFTDLTLRHYNFPLKKSQDDKGDTLGITSTMQINQFEGHQKDGAQFCPLFNREWMISYGFDGSIFMRSLMEPEKYQMFLAHSSFMGGIKAFAAGKDLKSLVSIGSDGIIRFWSWKYNATGKRMALDATAEIDTNIDAHKEIFMPLLNYADSATGTKFSELSDSYPSFIEELIAADPAKSSADKGSTRPETMSPISVVVPTEIASSKSFIVEKTSEIREKISNAISKNSTAPSMEKLEIEEFIIDEEENERLIADSRAAVEALEKDIEWQNDKQKVLFEKLKHELWDSMMIKGQVIKSFFPSILTKQSIQVQNYPLKAIPQNEQQLEDKIVTIRRTQVLLEEANRKKLGISPAPAETPGLEERKTADKNADKNNMMISLSDVEDSKLLFDPFSLTSREKKRIQVVILQSIIRQIKIKFNGIFDEVSKMKRDDITKIEDKNDRIKEILTELSISEDIFIPSLDDEEIPEKIVTVTDSEVKSEKFITAEERKKLEEEKKAMEMRKLAEKNDNWRERALLQMMNGKLEDKSEKAESEEILKQEWMSKPKNEMTEEEKKLFKEYEKKLATMREEQEKHRKALETELRKVQTFISDVCNGFDKKLAQFFQSKISADQILLQLELQVSKLQKSLIFSEDDDEKEAALVERMNFLKQEKTACITEIPEIKKDLEHCREDYEMAVKRDKEFEKQFKKEFHGNEFHYDALWRLFKRRDHHNRALGAIDGQGQTAEKSANNLDTLNPFEIVLVQNAQNTIDTLMVNTINLNPETDMPEGLPKEVWDKLVEFRDRKILLEQDVKVTSKKFNEMQNLVSQVVHESERIKVEMDILNKEYEDFLEYKFMSIYNLEGLFVLKQGQIEVPQAPVLTDYADAVMIHRSVVERLNEQIISLGKSKVDALVDMKNYRKGIHALEWENKVFDFQADNLIDRTRDIQLLRVTKQMQDYIRSGDETKQSAEVSTLEKRMEHNAFTHKHKLDDKYRTMNKLKKKIKDLAQQNEKLDSQLKNLELVVNEREEIHQAQEKHKESENRPNKLFQYARMRSKYLETIKQQDEDLHILRQEVERLKWKTVPHLSDKGPRGRVDLLKTNTWTNHVQQAAAASSIIPDKRKAKESNQ